jgi:hypothetical protein
MPKQQTQVSSFHARLSLSVEAPDVLFVAGQPRSRNIIRRTVDGSPSRFVDRREGRDLPWTKERH